MGIIISAFAAEPTQFHGRGWATWENTDRLGFIKTEREWMAGDFASWGTASGELRLPRATLHQRACAGDADGPGADVDAR